MTGSVIPNYYKVFYLINRSIALEYKRRDIKTYYFSRQFAIVCIVVVAGIQHVHYRWWWEFIESNIAITDFQLDFGCVVILTFKWFLIVNYAVFKHCIVFWNSILRGNTCLVKVDSVMWQRGVYKIHENSHSLHFVQLDLGTSLFTFRNISKT